MAYWLLPRCRQGAPVMIIYKNSFAEGRTIAHRCMPVNKIHGADVGRFFFDQAVAGHSETAKKSCRRALSLHSKNVSSAIHSVKEIVAVLGSLIQIALTETAPTI